MSPEPLPGLYVHVPFCSAICPYCDFAVTLAKDERMDRFVRMIEREIALASPSRPHDTVYFGGGTPSRLPAGALSHVLSVLDDASWLSPEARVFVEMNPEDASPSALEALASSGVQTVSLGVQALDDDVLRFLGRHHSAKEAARSVEAARSAGMVTVSADLIYGIPGQSPSSWRAQLEAAVALGLDHLSCYQLTIHEKTMFAKRGVEPPSESVQAELFRLTHLVLADLGFDGYEVSNFARSPEHRSKHNEKYWRHVPYRGLGPSAHSFDGHDRFWNERSFFDWERRLGCGELPVAGREHLTAEALSLETLMLRLRTKEGLEPAAYRERFGVDLVARAERAIDEGLLRHESGWLRPTLEGMAVADGLAVSLHR